jgi:hypothetical protein
MKTIFSLKKYNIKQGACGDSATQWVNYTHGQIGQLPLDRVKQSGMRQSKIIK